MSERVSAGRAITGDPVPRGQAGRAEGREARRASASLARPLRLAVARPLRLAVARPLRLAVARPLRLAVVALATLIPGASPGSAQEAEGGRGWLGVGLQEVLTCSSEEDRRSRCARDLLVTQVFVGSPADRAGVEPGDTLLSVDGRPVTRGARDPSFSRLRAGRPVRLEVGRDGGRRTVSVVPGRRPDDLAGLRVRGHVPVPTEVPEGGRLPEVAEAPLPAPDRGSGATAWESGGPAGSGAFRIHLDSGTIRISPMGAVPGAEGSFPGGVRVEPGAWAELHFGPGVRALQDSVFLRARVRLDSIRKLWERSRATGSPPRPGEGGLVAPGPHERRLAGAEFTPLNPGLAEFFQGPDRGLLVLRVLPGTPAARLGLRPGDVVLEAGGRRCEELDDLREALRDGREPGPLVVRWSRKGTTMSGTIPGD